MLDDEEFTLFRKAYRAYQAWCRRHGRIFSIPAKADTEFGEDGTVTLRNVNGELYTYRPRVNA